MSMQQDYLLLTYSMRQNTQMVQGRLRGMCAISTTHHMCYSHILAFHMEDIVSAIGKW